MIRRTISCRRHRRILRQFHAHCDRWGIQQDARERLLRAAAWNVGWYSKKALKYPPTKRS